MSFKIRTAEIDDCPEIAQLIAESVRKLSREDYDAQQIELSIKTVFGVDTQLIEDETYFVAEAVVAAAEDEKRIVGCGGWSKRKTLYGASVYSPSRDSAELNPDEDAAKIRAFFIHPEWARKGIGRAILEKCESQAKARGFKSAEMMATLPGVKLYIVCGYQGDEEVRVPVGENVDIICIKMRKNL